MRLYRRAVLSLAMVSLALGSCQTASAAVLAYSTTAQGNFGILNLETGVYSSIGSTHISTTLVGLGNIGGVLYGVDNTPGNAGIYTINGSTGAATVVSTLGTDAVGATTAGSSILGIQQGSSPFAYSATTAGIVTVTSTNPLGGQADGLVASNSILNALFVGVINPGTGQDDLYYYAGPNFALVGSLGHAISTGFFVNNTLYTVGAADDPFDDQQYIYKYSVSLTGLSQIGAALVVSFKGGNPNSDQITALTLVPEPASVVMAGIAIAIGAVVCRRKRRPAVA